MRSRKNYRRGESRRSRRSSNCAGHARQLKRLTDREVMQRAQDVLGSTVGLPDHGWKCTAAVVLQVLLLAASRMVSVFAACRDLAAAPSDQAVRDALDDGLPKRPATLERRLQDALCYELPRKLISRRRRVAIDWHQVPYHGEPDRDPKELRGSKPKSGTTKFHVYATACVVEHGHRYTLAYTWVKAKESHVSVLKRLLDRVAERGVRIALLLVDREFFSVAVMLYLQATSVPFLMPVVMRGRKPKKRRPGGIRAFRRRDPGRYSYTMGDTTSVTFDVIVAIKNYRHHRTGKRKRQKLIYAAWRVPGTATEIRELYRKRFGIEASYRQLREARIRTSTRDPKLRLLFIGIALVLRNIWVWMHATLLAEYVNGTWTLRLEKLRFRRMLNWIAQVVTQLLHNGEPYSVELPS